LGLLIYWTVIKFDLVIIKTFDLKFWTSEIRSIDPQSRFWIKKIPQKQIFLLQFAWRGTIFTSPPPSPCVHLWVLPSWKYCLNKIFTHDISFLRQIRKTTRTNGTITLLYTTTYIEVKQPSLRLILRKHKCNRLKVIHDSSNVCAVRSCAVKSWGSRNICWEIVRHVQVVAGLVSHDLK